MTDDFVWIAVTSDGTVTAWDSADAARNHLRDEPGQVWVEHVTINRTQEPTGAPSAAQEPQNAPAEGSTAHAAAYRRTWISPPGLIYPERPRGETA